MNPVFTVTDLKVLVVSIGLLYLLLLILKLIFKKYAWSEYFVIGFYYGIISMLLQVAYWHFNAAVWYSYLYFVPGIVALILLSLKLREMNKKKQNDRKD